MIRKERYSQSVDGWGSISYGKELAAVSVGGGEAPASIMGSLEIGRSDGWFRWWSIGVWS